MWLLLLAVAYAGEESDEVCLLSLRSAKRSPSPSFPVALTEWSQRHSAVKQALRDAVELRQRDDARGPSGLMAGSSELDMDQFIAQSKKSGDVCHAKVLEVKRTLDGLHMKVDTINAEMEANLQILDSQRRMMEDKEKDLADAKQDYKDAIEVCKEKKKVSDGETGKVTSWLEELINYAEPSVRSSIAVDINYGETATTWAKELAADKNANVKVSDDQAAEIVREIQEQAAKEAADAAGKQAMVQLQAGVNGSAQWDQAQCDRVKAKLELSRERILQHVMNSTVFLQGHDGPVKYRELDCNASRAVLQEEYNKAYKELSKLKEQTANDGDEAYNLCVEEAKTALDEASARLNNAIQVATRNMERAEDVNSNLQPLLLDAQRALAKVQTHLEELQGSCVVEDSVSGHLDRVRDLIISLQKCPGRHDFKLTVPEV
jgi:hypothetical protein